MARHFDSGFFRRMKKQPSARTHFVISQFTSRSQPVGMKFAGFNSHASGWPSPRSGRSDPSSVVAFTIFWGSNHEREHHRLGRPRTVVHSLPAVGANSTILAHSLWRKPSGRHARSGL